MKGRPLLELFLVGAVALVLVIPLANLGGKQAASSPQPRNPEVTASAVRAFITLQCSETPVSASLSQQGTMLWKADTTLRNTMETSLDLLTSAAIVELELTVEFEAAPMPGHSRRAVELKVMPDGCRESAFTFWTDDSTLQAWPRIMLSE